MFSSDKFLYRCKNTEGTCTICECYIIHHVSEANGETVRM